MLSSNNQKCQPQSWPLTEQIDIQYTQGNQGGKNGVYISVNWNRYW